jgi:uncharacterized 2Fe-2S/4Fe-4S cluster protein (DUF4445 family)
MSDRVRIRLVPLGAELEVDPGASLESALFHYGVEFPCGGAGICSGCRVRVIEGHTDPTAADRELLSDDQIEEGWRLCCQLRPRSALTLGVEQWDTPVLADFEPLTAGTRDGLGVVVDLGTTTIVVQLVNLATGAVLAVRTALNPQSAYGADVMSRVELALRDDRLTHLILGTVTSLVEDVACGRPVQDVVVVGNTAMHHIFCGLDVTPLSHVPFRSSAVGEQTVTRGRLRMRFLRCLGGFVGSDVLAGVVATGIHGRKEFSALIDLGTNGEIVVGNRDRLLCASTAAGPAFEGGRISMGMRAATGAVSHVGIADGILTCRVIGDVAARGVCGSGLVDAVAAGLNLNVIRENGRLANGNFRLCNDVELKQSDIRELQLAKGAVAAGLRILTDRWGATPEDLEAVYLAGAFGNYIDVHSAARIGLLPVQTAKVHPAGNTALRGARMLLLNPAAESGIHVDHVELAADENLQDEFAAALSFPAWSVTT